MARTGSAAVPELLSPAGDFDCARAAVENGADAVYFGLRVGLNARSKAKNFALEELPEFMDYLHLRGVKGFVTLNTLVFPTELDLLENSVRAVVAAGVDAAIVQDIGAARLIRAIAPDFELHASTQMSITSAEGVELAARLGISRVVLARELSIDDVRLIREATDTELEVFVHGALCMSYSGQCNASYGMGGRSANRGSCAQQCRLPYELICDGEVRDLQDRKYLLSPSDLSALDLVPQLIAAGVSCLKIEGRMKPPEYVAAVTKQYRHAIDEGVAGRAVQSPPDKLLELESPFSRGLSHGWLAGRNLTIVDGRNSANRGILVGKVAAVRGERVEAELVAPLRRGDGIAFPSPLGETHDQGGRVYEIFARKESVKKVEGGQVELAFGRDAIEFVRLRPGQEIWKTDDPQIDRRLRQTFEGGKARRRVAIDVTIEAAVRKKLRVTVRSSTGATFEIESEGPLEEAKKHPLTLEVLREQFGRLGTSVYELRDLDARIEGRPMAPLSVLGQLRHEMVRFLDESAVKRTATRLLSRPECRVGGSREHYENGALRKPAESNGDIETSLDPVRNPPVPARFASRTLRETKWHFLCRESSHVEELLSLGATSIIGDFAELPRCARAVKLARERGAEIYLATPRIQKPGEEDIFRKIAAAEPDGLLVRNLGGVTFCAERKIPFIADMTLNAVNQWTVDWLLGLGALRVAAAYDSDRRRLVELADAAPWAELEAVVHQYIPLFHTEHCIFDTEVGGRRAEVPDSPMLLTKSGVAPLATATAVSYSSLPALRSRPLTPEEQARQEQRRAAPCSFACMKHEVRLRDRMGVEHPLQSDACCRNTLYHAEPQNFFDHVEELKRHGIRHFRIELLDHVPHRLIRRALGDA